MARKSGLFLLVLLLFLGSLFGVVFSVKETVVTALINWAVQKNGISIKKVPVQSIGIDEATLGPIAALDDSLAISKITLRYSPAMLLAGTFDRLDVEGVVVELLAGPTGVELPFLNTFPKTESSEKPPSLLPLPFNVVHMSGSAKLKYEGVDAPFDIQVQLDGRQMSDGYSITLVADAQTLGSSIESEILLTKNVVSSKTRLTLKDFKPSVWVRDLPFNVALTGKTVFETNGSLAGLFGDTPLASQQIKLVHSEMSMPMFQFGQMKSSNVKLKTTGEGSLDRFAGKWNVTAELGGEFPGGQIAETVLKATGRIELEPQNLRFEASLPGFPFSLTLNRSGKDASLLFSGIAPSVESVAEWSGQVAKIKGKYLGGSLKQGIVPADLTFGEGAFDLIVGGSNQLDAKFSIKGARTNWAKTVPIKKNLTLDAAGEISGKFALSVNGDVRVDQAIKLPFSLKHDLSLGRGGLNFTIPSTVFAPKGLQPSHFFRGIKGAVSSVEGGMSGEGGLIWGEKERSWLSLRLENIGFHTAVAKLSGIHTEIDFNSLFPLSTAKKQTITASLVDVGIPFSDLAAVFDLSPDGTVSVEELIWPFAGGVFNLGEASFNLTKQRHKLRVSVADMRLEELSKTVNLEGLSGTGQIGGTFPLLMEGGALFVNGAELSSRGKGVLKYLAPATGGALKSAGENTNLLVKALENFHYDALVLKLNGDLAREVEVRVELAGNNPELYDGYPLRLNFTISGALGDMIRKGMIGMDIPESVKRKLQSRH